MAKRSAAMETPLLFGTLDMPALRLGMPPNRLGMPPGRLGTLPGHAVFLCCRRLCSLLSQAADRGIEPLPIP